MGFEPRCSRSRITRAGFPTATVNGGRSPVTTLPAPTTQPSPIVTPGRMHVPIPISVAADLERAVVAPALLGQRAVRVVQLVVRVWIIT